MRIVTNQDVEDLGFVRTDGRNVFEAEDDEGEPDDGRGPAFLSPSGPVAVTLELSCEASLQMMTGYAPDYDPSTHLSPLPAECSLLCPAGLASVHHSRANLKHQRSFVDAAQTTARLRGPWPCC